MSRVVHVHDADDPRIAAYVGMRERDLVGHGRKFVAEGELVLRMLLSQSRFPIESVFVLDSRLPKLSPVLAGLPDAIPIYCAERPVMDRVVGFPIHRGVLAIGRRGPEPSHGELLSGMARKGVVVGLIGVSNHDNVGGIFRNAAAFGADAVLLDATSCDPLYRKAIRVSTGASLKVPFARGGSADEMLRELAAAAYDIVGLSPGGRETLDGMTFGPRTALLFGAEGEGLPPDILPRARSIRVPMAPGFDSLNVATVSGIVLYKALSIGRGTQVDRHLSRPLLKPRAGERTAQAVFTPYAKQSPMKLRTLLGDYPVTRALKQGDVRSPDISLDFADVKVPSTAFKRVVRDLEFDVAELALVTYLIAKAHGKPLVLMPAVVLCRFQHPYIVYNAERGPLKPGGLAGRRVGIRSYSVTTVTWIKGILADDYGVDLDRVTWVTFEEPHVAEFKDPPNVRRAPEGNNIMDMLLAGEIDAAILAAPAADARIKPLIPDPEAAAQDWHRRTGAVQINHMVVVKDAVSRSNPGAVREIYRLLHDSKKAAGLPRDGELDLNPFGLKANRRNLEVAIDFAYRQRLIPGPFEVDELFDDVTRALGA
jgi:4,5-dihydroxyphthalate decarboxylase